MSPRERLITQQRRERSGGGAGPGGDGRGRRGGAGEDPDEQERRRLARGRLVGIITVVALVALIVAAVLKNPGGLTGIEPGTKIAPVRGAAGERQPGRRCQHRHPRTRRRLRQQAGVQRARQPGPQHLRTGRTGPGGARPVRQRRLLPPCAGRDAGAEELVPGRPVRRRGDQRLPPRPAHPDRQERPHAPGGDRRRRRARLALQSPQLPPGQLRLPGGKVQSRALLATPTPATLRSRVAALVAASRARGWHGAPA